MKKLTKQETANLFFDLTNKYGVLDHSRSGGGHDRFRLGKEGTAKPMFLACSRVGWMRVFFDKDEESLLESNGFLCEQTTYKDEKYDYKTRVNAEEFDTFLKLVQSHLGR